MKELCIKAIDENLNHVMDFIEMELEKIGCSQKIALQIVLAVEEIFTNIADYAYMPEEGMATIKYWTTEAPSVVNIEFSDNGNPFNPLINDDVDITLSAEEREIGGLGIHIVKKSMTNVQYKYENKANILTIKKVI